MRRFIITIVKPCLMLVMEQPDNPTYTISRDYMNLWGLGSLMRYMSKND